MAAINNNNNNDNANKKNDIKRAPSKSTMYGEGYPKGASKRGLIKGIPLEPSDHQHKEADLVELRTRMGYKNPANVPDSPMTYYKNASEHFTRDVNDPQLQNTPVVRLGNELDGVDPNYTGPIVRPVFSGATTNVNPLGDQTTESLLAPNGFRAHEISSKMGGDPNKEATSQRLDAPTSPLQPFTTLHPTTARNALLNQYNRTKIPIADAEWRKGFRHIFISRPECYIMAKKGTGAVLSEQCSNDEDFYSAFMRSPHLCSLLSPVYVTGSFSNDGLSSNWNFLLSNRVMGLSMNQTSLTVDENVPKSIEGFTVTPAKLLESEHGGTVELTFRDTRNLEVYDCLRLWMLYPYKCKRGILAPSYNGYQYSNGFLDGISKTGTGTTFGNSTETLQYHPYDRALDYCASLFDIVTNEAGTKILYWCKYYGIYPVSASQSLSNESGGAITNEMSVSATFRYQKKKEFSVHNLVEFNYNTGLCDAMGNVVKNAVSSLPFLLRDGYEDPSFNYLGAAGMFTGSPYIVMASGQHDATSKSNITIPYLRFMWTNNNQLNLGMDARKAEKDKIASY